MAENEMNKGLSQVSIRLVQESPLLSCLLYTSDAADE